MSKVSWQLSIGLLILGSVQLGHTGPPQKKEQNTDSYHQRSDLYGDPLPKGAFARIGTVRFRDGNSVMDVAFSPDGKTLASVGHSSVRIWNVATGRELRRYQLFPSFYRGAFAPDGGKLWLQTYEGLIYVWNLSAAMDSGLQPGPVKGLHPWFFALSPDGKLLVTGKEKSIRLWEIATGKELRELEGHEAAVLKAVYSRDGKVLATSSSREIIVWDAVGWKKLARLQVSEDRGRSFNFSSLTLSPDGNTVAAIFYGQEYVIRFWEAATGKELRSIPVNDVSPRCLVFAPDGKTIALGSQQGFHLWETATGKELWQSPMGGFFTLAFSPDSKIIAGGFVFMVRMWDTATGREICPIPEHRQGISFLALSADGRTVITEGQTSPGVPGAGASLEESPGLRYWQAETGMRLLPAPGHDHRFPPLADLSANGKTLAAWSKEKAISLWDVSTGKELGQIPYQGEPTHCKFSPDGSRLLVGTRDPQKPPLEGDEELELYEFPSVKSRQ
jgi:WD40 repeat protein